MFLQLLKKIYLAIVKKKDSKIDKLLWDWFNYIIKLCCWAVIHVTMVTLTSLIDGPFFRIVDNVVLHQEFGQNHNDSWLVQEPYTIT